MLHSGAIHSHTADNTFITNHSLSKMNKKWSKKNVIVPGEGATMVVARKPLCYENFIDNEKALEEIPLEDDIKPIATTSIPLGNDNIEKAKRELLSIFNPSRYIFRNGCSIDEEKLQVEKNTAASFSTATREQQAGEEGTTISPDPLITSSSRKLVRYKSLKEIVIPAPDLSMSPILSTTSTFSVIKRSYTSCNIASLGNENSKIEKGVSDNGLLAMQTTQPIASKSEAAADLNGAVASPTDNANQIVDNALEMNNDRSETTGSSKWLHELFKHWVDYMAVASSSHRKKVATIGEAPWKKNDNARTNLMITDIEEVEQKPPRNGMEAFVYNSDDEDEEIKHAVKTTLPPEQWKIAKGKVQQRPPVQFAGVAVPAYVHLGDDALQPRLLLHCVVLQITTCGQSKGYNYHLNFSVTNNPTVTHTGVMKSIGKGISAAHPRTVLTFNVNESFRFVCEASLEPYHLKDFLWDKLKVFKDFSNNNIFEEGEQKKPISCAKKGQLVLDSGHNPIHTFATHEVERYTIDISAKQSVDITIAFWLEDRAAQQEKDCIQEQPLKTHAEKEQITMDQFEDQVTRYCRVGDYLYFYTKGSSEKPEWVRYWATYENSYLLIKVAEDLKKKKAAIDDTVKSIPLEYLTEINTNPPKTAKDTIYADKAFNIILTFGYEQMFISCHNEHSFLMWKSLFGRNQSSS